MSDWIAIRSVSEMFLRGAHNGVTVQHGIRGNGEKWLTAPHPTVAGYVSIQSLETGLYLQADDQRHRYGHVEVAGFGTLRATARLEDDGTAFYFQHLGDNVTAIRTQWLTYVRSSCDVRWQPDVRGIGLVNQQGMVAGDGERFRVYGVVEALQVMTAILERQAPASGTDSQQKNDKRVGDNYTNYPFSALDGRLLNWNCRIVGGLSRGAPPSQTRIDVVVPGAMWAKSAKVMTKPSWGECVAEAVVDPGKGKGSREGNWWRASVTFDNSKFEQHVNSLYVELARPETFGIWYHRFTIKLEPYHRGQVIEFKWTQD